MNITNLVGSVVYAWFPQQPDLLRPGRKFRPCLVVDINLTSNELLLAYGTSQQTERLDRGQITIKQTEMPSLDKDTKFSLCSQAWVPVSTAYLSRDQSQLQIQVVGRVPRSSVTRLLRALEEASKR